MKSFENFDYQSAPGLNVLLIKDLIRCEYINQNRNVILLGKSGTGNYRKFLFMERNNNSL
jgi:DNA replication protein DnaC